MAIQVMDQGKQTESFTARLHIHMQREREREREREIEREQRIQNQLISPMISYGSCNSRDKKQRWVIII